MAKQFDNDINLEVLVPTSSGTSNLYTFKKRKGLLMGQKGAQVFLGCFCDSAFTVPAAVHKVGANDIVLMCGKCQFCISKTVLELCKTQLDLNANPDLVGCAPVCKNCHSCVLATYSNEKWARYKCLRWTCMCSYTRPAKRANDPISVGVPPDRFGPIEQNNSVFMKPWLQGFVINELKMAPPLQGKDGVAPNNAAALMAATQQEDFQF
jgi:hypothetical protein